jgi:phosphoglycolate phosphatase-like HAD superfamily hydrolase
MKLVLFDIDGTILKSRNSGRTAVSEALRVVCGREMDHAAVSFAGRTDPEIMRDLLLLSGCPEPELPDLLPRCLSEYVSVMMRRLTPATVTVLPGVRELIGYLHGRKEVTLGLLTGNLQETAYLKLHAAGLGSCFSFGAFGSDMDDRNSLPDIAVSRAFDATGIRFSASNTIIIGDTPHDVGCATGFGARSVAVCTGSYSREALSGCGATLLLDDLSDARPVLDLLELASAVG